MNKSDVNVRIRKMNEADLRDVKEVDHALRASLVPGYSPFHIEEHWWKYRYLPNFVAEADNKLVGFLLGDVRGVKYRTIESSAWIDLIGIMPGYQSLGIGRMLVKAFCDECHREGVKVRAFTSKKDERLVKFWESCGFKLSNLVSYEF